MRSPQRRTLVTAAALSVAGLFTLAAAAPAPRFVDGYLITQRISTDEGSMAGTITAKIAKGQVRMELDGLTQGPQAFIGDGYMLLRDDGRMAIVLPDQRQVMVMDPGALAGGMQAFGGQNRSDVSDVGVTVDDLGAGERILGYATRKYRVTQKSTVSMSGRGQARRSTEQTTSEVWIAPDLGALDPGFEKFASSFGSIISGGAGGGASAVAEQVKAKMPKGFPLKSVVTSVTTDLGNSSTRTSVSKVEVIEVTKRSFEASEFELPAGYPVLDLGQMMGQFMRGRGGM